MANSENLNAMKEIIKNILYLIENNSKNSTKIETCQVVSINIDGTYEIKLNGISYIVEKYGDNILKENTTAKLFIPSGNMNLAFIM